MKIKSILITLTFLIITLSSSTQETGTFKDSRDGEKYKTIKIGNQIWMAENLNYSIKKSWCYKNDSSNCAKFGRLYDWETAKNICPLGWHLPSDSEWTMLSVTLGGKEVAGGKIKEAGIIYWKSPNTHATNESGFSALPGGYEYNDGSFDGIGICSYWWSSTESVMDKAYSPNVYYDASNINRDDFDNSAGFSVRCLKN